MSMLTKRTCYKLNEAMLQTMFNAYIKDQYGYEANIHVMFEWDEWLPIKLSIANENTEAFHSFWVKLQEAIHSLPNKHQREDEEFEFGDKLLQLCLHQPTMEYFTHDNVLYVFVDENKPLELDQQKGMHYAEILREKMNWFDIREEDFNTLHTENVRVSGVHIEKKEQYVQLMLQESKNTQLTMYISAKMNRVDASLDARLTGYCHSKAVLKEIHRLGEAIINVLQKKLGIASSQTKMENDVRCVPYAVTYYEELTPLESITLSLLKHGLGSEEMGELLGRTKKGVDNTFQRIAKKEKEAYECLRTPSFVLRGSPNRV